MADRRRATREGSHRRRPRIWSAAATAGQDGHEDPARRAYGIFDLVDASMVAIWTTGYKRNENCVSSKISLRMADGAECSDG